ncbi:SYI [Hepatospora eriocheir]|uniref:SYI n=1 Tax=Hepatospora eriocheir TaxID=1081669 RepID=A0A1X0QF66_9MICR|nr:SYI [Hepatospora eriocheir]
MMGSKVDNLHKQYVDRLKISKNGKNYKRIPEVLDCWFESGSMPYAREHFPFSKIKDLVSTMMDI